METSDEIHVSSETYAESLNQNTIERLEERYKAVLYGLQSRSLCHPSRYHVRVSSSIPVPRFLRFRHSVDALHGWLGFLVNSKCEVYHMRRTIKEGRLSDLTPGEDDWRADQCVKRKGGPDAIPGILREHLTRTRGEQFSKNADGDECKTHQEPGQENPSVKYVEDILDDCPGRNTTTRSRFDPPIRVVYYMYKTPIEKRKRILQYAAFIVGHLGVFAFLFQVFDDRGAIMQICCYFQLFVLLLCFMLYAFSYLMDFKIIHNIRKEAERVEDMQRRHHDLRPDGVGRYIHCIYAVGEFTLSPYQHEEKYRVLSKLEPAFDLSCNNSIISPALDFLFAISVIFVECLTIVYIHNNTRGDTQGQDETSQ